MSVYAANFESALVQASTGVSIRVHLHGIER